MPNHVRVDGGTRQTGNVPSVDNATPLVVPQGKHSFERIESFEPLVVERKSRGKNVLNDEIPEYGEGGEEDPERRRKRRGPRGDAGRNGSDDGASSTLLKHRPELNQPTGSSTKGQSQCAAIHPSLHRRIQSRRGAVSYRNINVLIERCIDLAEEPHNHSVRRQGEQGHRAVAILNQFV